MFCVLCGSKKYKNWDWIIFSCLVLCLIDTDYSKEKFPNASCILDYLRCSITFKTPKDLLNGVEFVINEIENKKIESVTRILRIKNGFQNVLKWDRDKLSDYNYVDLKMNVAFNNRHKTESQYSL